MGRALLVIWLRWAVWVTLFSLGTALVVSLGITLTLYLLKGAVALDDSIVKALREIALFWFGVSWSVTLPLGTFLGMKQLFVSCRYGYRLQLLTCHGEHMETVHYNALVKAWRKWLFLTVWGVAVGVLMITTLQFVIEGNILLSSWWNSYSLYVLVMFFSWATLRLMVQRCPSIEMRRC